jgi:hypothetical protein
MARFANMPRHPEQSMQYPPNQQHFPHYNPADGPGPSYDYPPRHHSAWFGPHGQHPATGGSSTGGYTDPHARNGYYPPPQGQPEPAKVGMGSGSVAWRMHRDEVDRIRPMLEQWEGAISGRHEAAEQQRQNYRPRGKPMAASNAKRDSVRKASSQGIQRDSRASPRSSSTESRSVEKSERQQAERTSGEKPKEAGAAANEDSRSRGSKHAGAVSARGTAAVSGGNSKSQMGKKQKKVSKRTVRSRSMSSGTRGASPSVVVLVN